MEDRLNPSRLKWACRRGMLELDLLLLPYAETGYPNAARSEQEEFEALLKSEDQELFDWFIGKKEPPVEFAEVLHRVKTHAAQSRSSRA
ncbi:MAG: succinate dehydrogenase assembly factor 2 family protein [Gammaproteobacteria bacterium]|nr:succinate dehydrogenase assembly factor 2 family protein [Gammaproteobacteria bacterium]